MHRHFYFKSTVTKTYKKLFQKPSVAEVAKHEDKPQPQQESVPSEQPSAPAPKMDFGMSKPEDKDLYPTRGN